MMVDFAWTGLVLLMLLRGRLVLFGNQVTYADVLYVAQGSRFALLKSCEGQS